MNTKLKLIKQQKEPELLRLDLGTGQGRARSEGFIGVDKVKHEAVGIVFDLAASRWPWKDATVDEVESTNLLHVLSMPERIHFMNELGRVLKKGTRARIVVPHWCCNRYYMDPDVQWPCVSETWFMLTNKDMRAQSNSLSEVALTCNFDITISYGLHPTLIGRNADYQQHAVGFEKEAAQDLIVTLTNN